MQIGGLAKTVGVTTKAIRYYESIGVLNEARRTASGYRTYGPDAIERLRFVRQAQAAGLELVEIKSILEIKDQGGQSCQHTQALLKLQLDELDAKIIELRQARLELGELHLRAFELDPTDCVDSNRCQVIADTVDDTPT